MRVTRRRFLAVGGAGILLAACGQAAPPTSAPAPTTAPAAAAPTTAPAAAGTTAPAAATTTAPAAAATKPAVAAAPPAKPSGPVELQAVNVALYNVEADKRVFGGAYDILKQQTNGQITVKETLLPEDAQFYVKVLTMIAGGTPPDLTYVHPGQGLPNFAGQKVIVPLDPFIQSDKSLAFEDLTAGPLNYYRYP